MVFGHIYSDILKWPYRISYTKISSTKWLKIESYIYREKNREHSIPCILFKFISKKDHFRFQSNWLKVIVLARKIGPNPIHCILYHLVQVYIKEGHLGFQPNWPASFSALFNVKIKDISCLKLAILNHDQLQWLNSCVACSNTSQ